MTDSGERMFDLDACWKHWGGYLRGFIFLFEYSLDSVKQVRLSVGLGDEERAVG